ncbi:hypothetical protein [Thalassobacillus hwangdonensis]|uniref:Uncharacterized protein n=1 Tax=Thalassobacillus hwangdonensis TaxID=546108 RepID=A0ABW3L3I5_9BACI
MNKSKRFIAFLTFIVFVVIAGYTFYEWIRFGTINGSSIFFSFLALSYFLNWITWGEVEGRGEKDELDVHIKTQSTRISCFVLMFLSGLILFVSDGVTDLKDIDNYPLLIVVGLTFVTLPMTEFIYSKKYK